VENYQKYTPLDKNSVAELTEIYFKFIEKENVTDYDELVDSDDCIEGVGRIYRYLCEDCDTGCENYESALRMLHFFPGVAEYITYVVSGEYRNEPYLSDLEVDQWLCELKNEHEDEYSQALFLKLIGRYYLNPALKFDGTLQKENLSFKDYLFNGLPELKDGLLSNWQNEQYDSQYAELKRQVSGNRLVDPGNIRNKYKIRYIEPCGKSAGYGWKSGGCKYDTYGCHTESREVSDENKLLLLEKIASDKKLAESIDNYTMRLFEKERVALQYRDKHFEHHYPEREQQIICLDFLKKITLYDYGKFLRAIEYRKKIKDSLGYIDISIKCNQLSVTTHDIINNFLPYLVGMNEENSKTAYLLSEYNEKDVYIFGIEENTNNEMPEENRNFIYNVSGYNIHLGRFDSGSKKYMVAYFGNKTAAIKTTAGASFKSIATYGGSSNEIYIFYDNVPDKQAVITSVLKELGISKNLMDYLMGYIHNGNDTKTMNYLSRRRTFARV